ncbi:MAG: 2-isopropylmalate synthase [Roseburia sp.]|nr:2-isopropylmalate synthase [Roseburia sp.]
MRNCDKYKANYFLPPERCTDWIKRDRITAPPVWCSVDLRDGNQALVTPMELDEKIEFFKYLVKIGFKQIEIGFPAASDTEYAFTRRLIDDGLIPDDVTIQVLTQCREHIIDRTLKSLEGINKKNAIVHFYNSTSKPQREQVFGAKKSKIVDIAVAAARMIKDRADGYTFEYSPESFTGTEPEFALEICDAVSDVIKPTPDKKLIINLPVTVETSLPHVYACQVEYMKKNLKYSDSIVISTHPHNDRGTGVADAELAVLAGAERVEGTLFGNGERTGNVDIVTLALNMYSHGVDPKLDFSNLYETAAVYEKLTGMKVPPRQPYAGSLVFTAFSGSHQDAIAKGTLYRREHPDAQWDMPYLPVDPADVGRSYDADVIRINSQSGKGGIAYVLEQKYGYIVPKAMREDIGYLVKGISDRKHKELKPEEVSDIFRKEYVNLGAPLALESFSFDKNDGDVLLSLQLKNNGKDVIIIGSGNGQFNAAVSALKRAHNIDFTTVLYTEHALESGSKSLAAAYVGLKCGEKTRYAVGVDSDIMTASIKALIGAVNKILAAK